LPTVEMGEKRGTEVSIGKTDATFSANPRISGF
jgi:hypothetical protein